MAVKQYDYATQKNVKLSDHLSVWEFAAASDYNGNYPATILIDDGLPKIFENVYAHFKCSKGVLSSGYRTPACDKSVGGSGSGPHTKGIAMDVCFYDQKGNPIPSRIIACYLQDIGIKGIGVYCGGTTNWTHFDMRTDSVWYGDERDYSQYHNDYYSYTHTTEAEVWPNGKDNPVSPISSNPNNSKVDPPVITYRIRSTNVWSKELTGPTKFEGSPITDIAMKVSRGSIRYQVHVNGGGWLDEVTGYDINDIKSGYAGNGKVIDAIAGYYTTNSTDRSAGRIYYFAYRTKANGYTGFFSYQYDDQTTGGQDGYAGIFGKPITGFMGEITTK